MIPDSSTNDETDPDHPGSSELDSQPNALNQIHEELAAASAENRRNARRVFDVLKQFGDLLGSVSEAVNSLHTTTRTQAAQSSRSGPSSSLLDLIELSDRVDRISAAFSRDPAPASTPWWPPTRRAHQLWREDRRLLAESFEILVTHVRSLLQKSGAVRIPTEGQIFDPTRMTAFDTVADPSLPDHTVTAELLPGWLDASGNLVRPAQVRVSRSRPNLHENS